MRASIAAAALALATSTVPAAAQVPLLVSFQGRLTDAGAPVTGDVNLTFRIYDAATGGNLLWSEAQVATVAGGLFTVTLGETTPLSPVIFDGARWVGVTPGGGPELTPRIRLTSTPYAVRATSALSLEGLATPIAQLNQLDGIGPTVSGANLSSMTNGSSADGLHAHPGLSSAVGTLQSQVSALESNKVSKSGDTMTGVLVASAGIQYADGTTQTTAPSIVYTRWGRNTCPAGTQLTYAGYAAGSNFTHTGGGKNTLCLTDTPAWTIFNDANQDGALLYGLEYETAGSGLGGPYPALHNLDAECAVCLRTQASVTLMVPGTNVCPVGWTQEYAGLLMSTQFSQSGGEFVCVDENPVGRPGTAADSNGHLWYPTETECTGSIPCPPYVHNRELACTVCSR